MEHDAGGVTERVSQVLSHPLKGHFEVGKPSNDKGFWGGCDSHTRGGCDKTNCLIGHTPPVTPPREEAKASLLDQYQSFIAFTRAQWLSVPTPSGRSKKGPRWYAIVECSSEGLSENGQRPLGITSSSTTKAKRWVCKACGDMTVPIWTDGPAPDVEEAAVEWAEAEAKGRRR